MGGFSYVYIPVEPHKPMEEQHFPEDVGLENDQFIERLKTHFTNASSSSADPELLKQHMAQHASKEQLEKLDDNIMAGLASMTTVDIFPMLLPLQASGFHGVSVYVDDKGMSKKLPLNERASSLAQSAGYNDTKFYGDAFIAKIFDDQDAWNRIDIKLSEINSDAAWVKMVREQRKNKSASTDVENFKKMMGQGGMGGMMGGMGGANTPALQNVITQQNNQGSTDVYDWNEPNKEELEISFKADVVDKKKVKVNFSAKKIKVEYDGKELLAGDLMKGVEADDCTWSIVDKKKLVVTLMKKEEGLWSGVLAQ